MRLTILRPSQTTWEAAAIYTIVTIYYHYSAQKPTEGRRLSRPRWLANYGGWLRWFTHPQMSYCINNTCNTVIQLYALCSSVHFVPINRGNYQKWQYIRVHQTQLVFCGRSRLQTNPLFSEYSSHTLITGNSFFLHWHVSQRLPLWKPDKHMVTKLINYTELICRQITKELGIKTSTSYHIYSQHKRSNKIINITVMTDSCKKFLSVWQEGNITGKCLQR